MAEQRPLGCGLFSEEEWAELVAGSGPDAQADAAGRRELLEHVRTCAACRAELAALARLSQQVRHVLAEADATLHGAVREAFVAGVMAQVRQTRAGGGAPAGNAWAAGTLGMATALRRQQTGHRRRRSRQRSALVRRMRRSRARGRPLAAGGHGAMILPAVLAGGLPWTTPEHMRSTGQARRRFGRHRHGTTHTAAVGRGRRPGSVGRAKQSPVRRRRQPSKPRRPRRRSRRKTVVSLFSAPETTHEPAPEPGAHCVPGGFVSAVSGAPPAAAGPASEGGSANP